MSLFNFDQFRPISTNFSQFWPILAGRPVKIHFGRLFSNPDIYPVSTQYLHDIYPVSTRYLPSICTISTQYLHDIYPVSTHAAQVRAGAVSPRAARYRAGGGDLRLVRIRPGLLPPVVHGRLGPRWPAQWQQNFVTLQLCTLQEILQSLTPWSESMERYDACPVHDNLHLWYRWGISVPTMSRININTHTEVKVIYPIKRNCLG